MCGILGIAGASCPKEVEQALALIAHRGPDDQGIHADETVTLGHRRLSIIDLATGHQPFLSEDGRYVIVYNGELYNYRELSARLSAKGYRFRSRSDTEVLLYWLIEHGRTGLPDLNGMFAFAFWDRAEKRLLLARDRIGIKPLYYAAVGRGLVFASEVKAMLPWLPEVAADNEAIFQFLTFQNILDDRSFFKGVSKLLPGTWLEWTPTAVRRGSFWNINLEKRADAEPEKSAEAFRHHLANSVRRQLISDVPLGGYLSGGIDSSSVVTEAARLSDGPMHTFTGAFADAPYYDERIGSRAVAKAVGATLHEVEIEPAHYADHLADMLWHLDEPTLGTGALPQYMVSELVSRHVKVVLTGHGGDELFAGYQVNKVALLKETAARGWAGVPRVLANIRRDEVTRILYFLLFPLLVPEIRHGLFIMTPRKERARVLTPDFIRSVGSHDPFSALDGLVEGRGYSPGDLLTVLYLKTYLPTLLIQEDKVGMAHSIEARMPLCDNEMVDFALGLPLGAKLFNGRLKAIPREAMRDRLPEILFGLPKRGFPTPFARWYRREPVRGLMEDLLLTDRAGQRGIVDSGHVATLFSRNAGSRTDNLADYARANKLYSYALVELWNRIFIDRDPVAERIPGSAKSRWASMLAA